VFESCQESVFDNFWEDLIVIDAFSSFVDESFSCPKQVLCQFKSDFARFDLSDLVREDREQHRELFEDKGLNLAVLSVFSHYQNRLKGRDVAFGDHRFQEVLNLFKNSSDLLGYLSTCDDIHCRFTEIREFVELFDRLAELFGNFS
jgi:hypothetical protein